MDILKIKPNVVSRGVAGKYFLFYGEPSTRKTTVASMFPSPLLLATEIGYSLIPGVHAAPIKSWAEFRDIVRQLKDPKVKETYQTIIIDTVGLLTDMCMKFVCDRGGVEKLSEFPWGQGWNEFKKEFRTQLNTIAQLGYGIVLIAHSDTKKDNETGQITSALPMMDKKPREAVIAMVDFIFYLQKEPLDTNENIITVYAYSNLASAIETKSRARYLSPRFEFNFDNLEKEVSAAVEKLGEDAITNVVSNPYASSALPFETVKEEVLGLGALLLGENVDPDLRNEAQQALVRIMKGIKPSLSTEVHYDQMVALKEAFLEIKEKI